MEQQNTMADDKNQQTPEEEIATNATNEETSLVGNKQTDDTAQNESQGEKNKDETSSDLQEKTIEQSSTQQITFEEETSTEQKSTEQTSTEQTPTEQTSSEHTSTEQESGSINVTDNDGGQESADQAQSSSTAQSNDTTDQGQSSSTAQSNDTNTQPPTYDQSNEDKKQEENSDKKSEKKNSSEFEDQPPAYEDDDVVITGDNFWLQDNFKRVTKRIEDGAKLVDDLSKMFHERAEIENLYATKIKGWSKKWNTHVYKSPEYGTLTSSLQAGFQESDALNDLHLSVYAKIEDLSKSILHWKSECYQKSLTKYKEYKRSDEAYTKAQKPWILKYNEVHMCKAAYHSANSLRDHTRKQEEEAKKNPSMTSEQVSKITNKVKKAEQDIITTKARYEESLRDIGNYNPKYIDDMNFEFDKCQRFEEERRNFIKSKLLLFSACVDRTMFMKNYEQIYERMGAEYNGVDTKADLTFFQTAYGTTHPFVYLKYVEYDPTLHMAHKSTDVAQQSGSSPGEKKKKSGICTTL